MGRRDEDRSDTARPLSIPPELDDLDTRWDDDVAPRAPPGPASRGLDTDPGNGSALDLADRNTPIHPVEPPPLPSRPAEPLELLSTRPPPSAADGHTGREMRERYATGDYSGALAAAETILASNPGDDAARRCAASCREVLAQMCLARLGSPETVVRMAVPPERIRWLSLDHRAGFLLSLVDGTARVEDIVDMSGMAQLEVLRTLVTLLEQGVISVA